jgi:hypothetical protein
MARLSSLAGLACLSLFVSSCAGMMQSWRDTHCNHAGGYEYGMNAARRGEQMNATGFAYHCDEPTRAEAIRGYQEGYTRGIGGPQVVVGPQGAPMPPPPPSAQWRCERAYGTEDCGYRCVQAYGKIACAKHPSHNCLQAYGNVRCGLNCRVQYSNIVCDD